MEREIRLDGGLTGSEIGLVVNGYIGVNGGYLGDFSYSSHSEFYYLYCDLKDVDTNQFSGTTRQKFIQILQSRSPKDQAKILNGVLKRFPVECPNDEVKERRSKFKPDIESFISRLEGRPATLRVELVSMDELSISSEAVDVALGDADILMREGRPSSAVDRLHTALHGYLKAICSSEGIPIGHEPNVVELFKNIRERHPSFQNLGPKADEITRLLRGIASVVDTLNTLRNRGSVAHPNEHLLDAAEAVLYVNAAQTLIRYIEEKLKRS